MSFEDGKPLNEQELADHYGVTTRTLQNWRKDGVGPPYTPIGHNLVRYNVEDILQYEAEQRNIVRERHSATPS